MYYDYHQTRRVARKEISALQSKKERPGLCHKVGSKKNGNSSNTNSGVIETYLKCSCLFLEYINTLCNAMAGLYLRLKYLLSIKEGGMNSKGVCGVGIVSLLFLHVDLFPGRS